MTDKRLDVRQPVLKVAKILFQDSVVDCIVLDFSAGGARVSTDVVIPFPDAVKIELRSGGVWDATRSWQRGLETGFTFKGFAGLHAAATAEVAALSDRLGRSGVHDVTERLAEARWFDHPELKTASRAVDVAIQRLEQVLHAAARRAP